MFPDTREQRCWVHKTANILDALPKRLHRSAKAAIHEIYESETRSDAETQIDEFVTDYGDKYPKAVAKLANDRDVLLTFYDFPAAHWTHLRTTNPIESTFATVRARTKVTKGAGTRRRGLVMAYKLLDAAQERWRKVNSPELVALVHAGIEFKDGTRVERRTHGSRDARLTTRPHPQDLAIPPRRASMASMTSWHERSMSSKPPSISSLSPTPDVSNRRQGYPRSARLLAMSTDSRFGPTRWRRPAFSRITVGIPSRCAAVWVRIPSSPRSGPKETARSFMIHRPAPGRCGREPERGGATSATMRGHPRRRRLRPDRERRPTPIASTSRRYSSRG